MLRWSELSPSERAVAIGAGIGVGLAGALGVFVALRSRPAVARLGTLEYEMPELERLRLARTLECSRDQAIRGVIASAQDAVSLVGPKPEPAVIDVLAAQLYEHLGVSPPQHPCRSTA